jgi:hypothetical protein
MHWMFAPIVIFWLSLLGIIFAVMGLFDLHGSLLANRIWSDGPPETVPFKGFIAVVEEADRAVVGAYLILAVVFLLQFISVIWLTLVFKRENAKSK